MPNRPLQPSTAKYAWNLIGREMPHKRPAGDRVHDYDEVYESYDEEAVRAQASRCIQCPDPLCAQGCPLANRIPEWLAQAAAGNFLEAAELSRSTSNMPEICSRICPQERLCEGSCILRSKGEAVAIGAVERFINDYAFRHGAVGFSAAPPNGRSAAIIGSGPAGLACADELARLGYRVTVFESLFIPGGLLVNGIPSFKLEKHIVERRIDLLARNGVDFRLGVQVGRDLPLAQLRHDYDAVFLGHGAQKAKTAGVPGENLAGVLAALPFLIEKNLGSPLLGLPTVDVTGKRVAVLGGGDTAMDCLRTAIRAGAQSATCIYRRDLANMPGSRKEYANAVEEGAVFRFLTNPAEIVAGAQGGVAGVRCLQMGLGAPDASGRRKPVPVPGTEFEVPADLAIVAYGFDPVAFPEDSEFSAVKTNDWGGIVVDGNQMTSLPGVFAGGDSVRGPSLAVHAVRDARRAAQGIHRYLNSRRPDAAPSATQE
ncbi:MAG: NAD(P)-dependent oxidoreductase [Opitutales bacterium]